MAREWFGHKGIAMKKLAAMVVVFFAGLVAACGTEPPADDGKPCSITPYAPECSCDDENACTADAFDGNVCRHEPVALGSACLGEDGFCDVGNTCRQECDKVPCLDWAVQPGYGCVYSERPNGWTCVDDIGQSGTCQAGACVVAPTLCSSETTKCRTHDVASGWCGAWDGAGTAPSCKRCVEFACENVPGCAPIGSAMCQGGGGAGGCPESCCPVCFS